MVKRCVICGNVEDVLGVSVHKYLLFHYMHIFTYYYYTAIIFFFSFPSDAVRRDLWVQFVENQGFQVNRNSKLCSRHFIPGVDFTAGNQRRRLTNTSVPSIVSLL